MLKRRINLVAETAGKLLFKLLFKSGVCSKSPVKSSHYVSFIFFLFTVLFSNAALSDVGVAIITGTAAEDSVLSASVEDVDGTTGSIFTYQWKRDTSDISGATEIDYTLVQADVGSAITVTVDYIDDLSNAESVTSVATATVSNINDNPVGEPSISGTAAQGQVLTAITSGISDEDGLGPFSYQWKRGGSNISDATNSTYTLVQADVDNTMTVTVSYLDLGGTTETLTSSATTTVTDINDLPTGEPTISGTVTQDQVLTAITSGISDADGLGSFSYRWLRGGVDIGGATASTYTLVQADVGALISVRVSYTDGGNTDESVTSAQTAAVTNINDAPSGSPTISGSAEQGQILTVVTSGISDADGLGSFSYQWIRGSGDIVGATADTYTLVQADVGAKISVRVSYTDGGTTDESVTSVQTTSVTNTNDLPVGEPTISGSAIEGSLLTADTSGISDEDGGVSGFSYLWKRGSTTVGSASTYLLVQADVGSKMTVTVSYVDGGNTTETLISAETATVSNTNDDPVGSPVITGAATEGVTLGVDTSGISDEDGGVSGFSYQWKRGTTNVGTASTYLLGQADVGSKLTVTVSYVDGGNTTETLISAATATVGNTNDAPVGSPVITGAATEGVTLGVDTSGISDEDGLNAFSYQWLRDGADIVGATADSYTLLQADVAAKISVRVSYTDGGNTLETLTSAQTAAVANNNDAPVGSPSISGTAAQGQVLTAITSGISDADGMGSFSYQWKRGGSNIGGATANTYTLVQADVDALISVQVSYTDGGNTLETLTSAQTSAVTNINDAPSGSPTISGTVKQGQVLTAVTSGISDADGLGTFNYQWLRGGGDIVGATANSYTLVQADVGAKISVRVSYTDGGNTLETVTSVQTVAVTNINDAPVGKPTISGSVSEGSLLTADTSGISDADGLGTFSYQWLRNGGVISGATATTYTLVQADVDTRISVRVTYTDGGNTAESVTSVQTAIVTNTNNLPAGVPTISGSTSEDSLLTVNASAISDTDGLGAFSYQWLRDGGVIGGATATTYTLVQADVTAKISIRVSYTDARGTDEAVTSAQTATVTNVNDIPVGVPVINGSATEGSSLTVDTSGISDEDGLGSFNYRWLRNGADIAGATATTYTLVQADVDARIRIRVSYSDDGNTAESVTSVETATVTNTNDAPVGSPSISGIAEQGQVLTAVTSGISDADGLGSFNYQWLRDGSNIGGATNSTYTLVQADVNSNIKVTVSYLDGGGQTETLTSTATAKVTNTNDLPVGVPTISGSAIEGSLLTASTSGISDVDGLGAFSYQWSRGGTDIGGATGNTYTLVQADVDSTIRVTVSYLDGGNTSESVISAQTAFVANTNDTPVGSPSISGTATQGQVLTAVTSAISDADGLGPFSYQWLRNGGVISGATASTYTLVQADVGKSIKLTVSYLDGGGTTESLISSATGAVANINDSPVGSPTISGVAKEGQVLTAVTSGISDADGLGAFSYQWLRTGAVISGATNSSYTLLQVDVDEFISVRVSYNDGGNTDESLISAQTTAVANTNDLPAGSPTINGNTIQGSTLTADTSAISDEDGLGAFSYQWLRNGSGISGATSSLYLLVQADVGKNIRIRVSYTDAGNTDESVTSAQTTAITNVNDAPSGAPEITGAVIEDGLLTADVSGISDADGLGVFSYRWLRDGVDIGGAISSTYRLVQADVDTRISVRVSYTDGENTAESITSAQTVLVVNVNDNPAGSPVINGTPVQGGLLTANTSGISDADGLGGFNYQWLRDGVDIAGAAASTYTMVQADVGSRIRVRVSYIDGGDTTETLTSAATATVANINDAPAGAPTITGNGTQGGVLTVDTSGISDADGLGSFSYQWKRSGSSISGATNSSYTLVQADVGKTMTVVVSYRDDGGATETLTSAATAVITNTNDAPTGSPSINGTAAQGQKLTVVTTGIGDPDGLGAFSYRWLRGGSVISGATNNAYTLVQADVGSTIKVTVSYLDGGGTTETLESAATAEVLNVNDPPAGLPSITGIATENQTLTAVTSTISDVDGLGPFSYQWLRNGGEISSATANTYTLVQADVGAKISVRVSYTDGGSTVETVTSAQTTAVLNVNDNPVGAPVINGIPTQGGLLTANTSGISDADGLSGFNYQWIRNGVNITGAIAGTYTLVQADVGRYIRVRVSYLDGGGTTETLTSAATSAVIDVNDDPVGVPTISGSPIQGGSLTADASDITDADGLGPFSYQWLRGGSVIIGATSSSYTLVQADVAAFISVKASYTDGGGTIESIISAQTSAVIDINDNPVGKPVINGDVTQGQTIAADISAITDADGLGAFNYQWLRAGSVIAGATSDTYTLIQTDVGKTISVTVNYLDGGNTIESITSAPTAVVANTNDLPVGLPVISGTAIQNGLLIADASGISDVDGLGVVGFSYQWLRNGQAIAGATGITYTLVQADVETNISVRVSYTDGGNAAESVTSLQTVAVVNVNDLPVGLPIISGTPVQNGLLTADVLAISDADGLGGFSYQWKRGGSDIIGATASTYTLVQADVGSTITLMVTYVDGGNTAETVTSIATAAVANVNDLPVGVPIITGTVTQGGILVAGTSGISDIDGLGLFSYQWLRNGAMIPGATAGSYSLVQLDVGALISVQVTYTDGGNQQESVTSAQTTPVTNTNDAPVGLPIISGISEQNSLLTADVLAISDDDGLGAFNYQWMRGGLIIVGATAETYTLVQADVGSAITVTVSYLDGGGTTETLISAATAVVGNINDSPVGVPVIIGSITQNSLLTADISLVSDDDGLGIFNYQWLRDGVDIEAAIAGTYTLVQADVGTTISVRVNYIDGGNQAESVISLPTVLVANVNDLPVGLPAIIGIVTQGQVLTADTSGITDDDGLGVAGFSYQWTRDGIDIEAAITETYTLVQEDVGRVITVTVSYTDGDNVNESITSLPTAAVININDLPVGLPIISGSVIQGGTLVVDTLGITDADGLGVGGFSYQWLRGVLVIEGATASTYTLTQADVGEFISVTVSYIDGDNAAESVTSLPTEAVVNVNDDPEGVPTIIGITTQGEVLTVDASAITDADGLGIFAYQWLRDGSAIIEAISDTYTLAQEDVGAFISVEVSYIDGGLTEETVPSNQVGPVININDDGVVTIVGQATEASVLTVGSIVDADGTTTSNFIYQWLRDGADIVGATGDSYILVEADLATFITLRVVYIDDFGADEVVISNAKGPIFPDVPKVIPPAGIGPVDSTGWFTFVAIEQFEKATASDALDGVITPVSDSNGQFRPGVNIVTWSATDIAGNVGTATQEVRVVPLAEVSKIQKSAEGSSAEFKIILNGDALQYPVTVPYSVSDSALGTGSANADGSDHDLCLISVNPSACSLEALVATVNEPAPGELPEAVISFNIVDDGLGEGMESLIITLVETPEHAVLGTNIEHTVEIAEGNVAPLVSFSATQLQVDSTSDPVFLFAEATDANGDDLTYDWSGTDNAINGSEHINGVFSFDPGGLTPGFYALRVAVSDGTETVESELMLNVLSELPVLSSTADSDGDGINDADEGYGDEDSDGVADYLDAIQASNVIQMLTATSDQFVMQAEAGLKLSLGQVAFEADLGGALVSEDDVLALSFDGISLEDEIENVGGYFDFTVSELPVAGQSVQVVIPQLVQMPRSSVYRKLTLAGWQDFVKDENNSVASAAGEEGYCPPPGHSDYKTGLRQGHWCLQLTIEDGGPNDSDGIVNNSVTDPGGLGRVLTSVSVSSSGGGAWHPLLPALSIFIMLFFRNLNYFQGKKYEYKIS